MNGLVSSTIIWHRRSNSTWKRRYLPLVKVSERPSIISSGTSAVNRCVRLYYITGFSGVLSKWPPHTVQCICTSHKKIKAAHTRLPSVGFRSWSRFLAVSLQVTWVINPAVGCHYFPLGLRFEPGSFCASVQHANHSATEPPPYFIYVYNNLQEGVFRKQTRGRFHFSGAFFLEAVFAEGDFWLVTVCLRCTRSGQPDGRTATKPQCERLEWLLTDRNAAELRSKMTSWWDAAYCCSGRCTLPLKPLTFMTQKMI